MAIASLGEINFVTGTNDFSRIRRKSAVSFVEHKRLEGKPTIQRVGGALDDLTLDFEPHPLTSDGKADLAALRDLMIEGNPLSFTLAGEYLGLWVITDISESPQRINETTGEHILSYSLSLLEYIGVIVEAEEPTQDRVTYQAPAEGAR